MTNIDDTDASAIGRFGSGWQDSSPVGARSITTARRCPASNLATYSCTATPLARAYAGLRRKAWIEGMADVYVDGVLKQSVDTYAPQLQDSQTVFDTGSLPLGPHKIKVVVKPAKNAAANGFVGGMRQDRSYGRHCKIPKYRFDKSELHNAFRQEGLVLRKMGRWPVAIRRAPVRRPIQRMRFSIQGANRAVAGREKGRTRDWQTSILINNSCKRSIRTRLRLRLHKYYLRRPVSAWNECTPCALKSSGSTAPMQRGMFNGSTVSRSPRRFIILKSSGGPPRWNSRLLLREPSHT